jgi:hypothetical protein
MRMLVSPFRRRLCPQIDEDKVVVAHKKDVAVAKKGVKVRFVEAAAEAAAARAHATASGMGEGDEASGSDDDSDDGAPSKVPRNLSNKILREVRSHPPPSLPIFLVAACRRAASGAPASSALVTPVASSHRVLGWGLGHTADVARILST